MIMGLKGRKLREMGNIYLKCHTLQNSVLSVFVKREKGRTVSCPINLTLRVTLGLFLKRFDLKPSIQFNRPYF